MDSVAFQLIIAHLIGDYFLQSTWMAHKKSQHPGVAFLQSAIYTLPFLAITRNPYTLLFIFATHFIIDFWSIVRFIAYAKDFMSPKKEWKLWEQSELYTYPAQWPGNITTMIYLIMDNTLHLVCNAAALYYFG